jgi:hypothetical protein
MTGATPARWVAAPVVAVIFIAGVWVTGGLLTNDFKAAMALTAVWFGASGAACLAIALRWRRLRVPTVAAYLATAAGVGGYLAWTTLRDTVVHEHVVAGTPASHAKRGGHVQNLELFRAGFVSIEHESRGVATIVRLSGGERVLTLTRFSTSPGPDLRVRLVPTGRENGGADSARDLGALKGNKGDQQYGVPESLDIARYRTVVIWCRAFSVAFAKAELEPA